MSEKKDYPRALTLLTPLCPECCAHLPMPIHVPMREARVALRLGVIVECPQCETEVRAKFLEDQK